ncbi:hypothetical protein D3C85_1752360 [compost metagenome]
MRIRLAGGTVVIIFTPLEVAARAAYDFLIEVGPVVGDNYLITFGVPIEQWQF